MNETSARHATPACPYGRLGEALLEPQALGPELGEDPRAGALLEAVLRRGSLGLAQAVAESRLPTGTNLLLVDQFEELFRFRNESVGTKGANDADAFVRLLLDSAPVPPPRPGAAADSDGDAGGQVYVVLTMRSDFLGDCALFTGLPEAINDSQFLTPRMTQAQYRDVIEEPARLCGGALDPALVSRLLNDIRADPDQLPVLQHALMRMWTQAAEREGSNWDHRLTLANYQAEEIGGLKTALSKHCDQVLASLDKPRKPIAEVLFRALSERSDGRRDTRRPTTLSQIGDLVGVGAEAIVPVVDAFRDRDRSFLTPPPPEELGPETVLDISHESLISHWETLAGWVAAEATSADLYMRPRNAARRRADPKGGGAALWRAEDLKAALAWRDKEQPNAIWAERYGGDFALAMAFLDDSRVEEEQEAERRQLEQEEREQARQRQLQQAEELAETRARSAGTMRVWSLSRPGLLKKACRVSGRNLSPSEWRRYFGDEGVHLTCPGRPIHPDHLQRGRALALEGEIDQAVSELTEVLERFGTESLDPSRLAGRYAAPSEVEAGDKLARSGDISAAATLYQRAVDLDPSWRIVPAQRAAEIASWAKVREGDAFARNGDIPAAIAAYEQALDLYPTRFTVPSIRAAQFAALDQIERADTIASAGNIAEAVAAYEQAIELDPSQTVEPLARAQRLAAPRLRNSALDTAKAGNLDQALADYRRAAEWDTNLPTDPDIETGLCWFGSLWKPLEAFGTGPRTSFLTANWRLPPVPTTEATETVAV